ncbi:hypothetical protein QPL79_04600 [Ignisphaera sp. 4213-co]|uniref:Uncharacterized protein n=1 Tax=Ignisphaera cupida TaxID=3050454 RepID=A0ABD4Z6U2_9CREN|nr:hypothetical protein [Ignisphaera sp. 4213-co]MDK6028633.1 hypothetical protein [Ignisphaera sp. 4213-co]
MREDFIHNIRVLFVDIGNLVVGIAKDVGPRILFLAPKEKQDFNVFGVVPDLVVETPEGLWRIYGGHRLWTSPEAMPRSYSLDDKPVKIVVKDSEIVVEGNPEPQNCVLKRIRIRRGSDENSLEVVHEIENICRWPIEFSCWALTVMRQKGFAIIPIKPRCVDEKCLLPDRSLALWPYTKLSDRRLILGEKYIFIKQDPEAANPLKIGVNSHDEWAAYYVDKYLFIKTFRKESGKYPDFNSVIEVYTNNKILELETLGPLRVVEPGKTNIHVEFWKLIHVGAVEPSEEVIEKVFKNVLQL